MDCGTSMVKYTLFVFNALVSIIGIVAIVFGVIVLNSIGTIQVEGQTGFPVQALLPIGLILIGSIVLFIAFLGCCGAIRESSCMTMTYAFFMLVLLIVQLTLVVLLFTNKDKIIDSMNEVIDLAWEPKSREAGVFDALQQTFHCCGKNSAADYVLILKAPPQSCCPEKGECVNPINYYSGCHKVITDFVSGSTETSKYVGLGLIVVELLGFIFACCLANNIRNYKRRNAY